MYMKQFFIPIDGFKFKFSVHLTNELRVEPFSLHFTNVKENKAVKFKWQYLKKKHFCHLKKIFRYYNFRVHENLQ